MKISQKLTILFFLSALVPLSALTFVFYDHSSQALEHQISGQVASVALRQANAIEAIVATNRQLLDKLDGMYRLKLTLLDYVHHPTASVVPTLVSLMQDYVNNNPSVRDLTIYLPNGQRIATTGNAQAKTVTQDDHALLAAAASEPFTSGAELTTDGTSQQVLTKTWSLQGVPLGSVKLELETEGIKTVLQDYAELGAAGEAYLVAPDQQGALDNIFPLRYKATAALQPLTADATTALKSGQLPTTSLLSFKDYRDQAVLAAARVIDGTDWKLIAQVDQGEVLAPVVAIRTFALILVVVTAIAALGVAFWFSYIIIRPIRRFTSVVEQIRAGDLNRRATITSKDEIGRLGSAFNDMTDHLVELRAHLISSITSITQGFILVDASGAVVLANAAAKALFPAKTPDTGGNVVTLLAKLEGIDVQAVLEDCVKSRHTTNVANIKFEQSVLHLFISPVLVRDAVNGAVILIVDETEERIMQRSRDEFFSIASHELRTPLTAIRGNMSMAREYFAEALKDPSLHGLIDDTHDASVRLIGIVNDFLDSSKLEQGKMVFTFAPVALAPLVKAVAGDMSVLSTQHHNTIHAEGLAALPEVYADEGRLRQVFYNLIGNATTYSEDAHITVSGEVVKGHIIVRVTDTGRGIAADNQKLLFRKFQQASGSLLTRDTTKGTGLGLYISKLIVERLGGTIQLEHSEEGKGSTFSFTVPVATAAQKKAANEVKPTRTIDTATGLEIKQS